jgi:4-hydroxy-tetrahydrodipicolinate synthase
MIDYEQQRSRIEGPVYPILPAFTESGGLDTDATRAYIRYLSEHGAKRFMVTVGTSRFNLLDESEQLELNALVVDEAKRTNPNAYTIVTAPMLGPTSTSVRFAKHAEESGADSILLYHPERYYGVDGVVAHYSDVAAETNIPLLAHANPIRNATGGNKLYDADLLSRLAEIDSFIGLKEEGGDEGVRYGIASELSDRLAIIVAGGSMHMFMASAPHGVQSYLVGVGSFVPEIEERFFEAHANGNLNEARRIVNTYERPFFEVAKGIGWHRSMKTTLDLLDVMSPHERKPMLEALPAQRSALEGVVGRLGFRRILAGEKQV